MDIQMQVDKYMQCLMNVNIDLGILIQNAENLAYKLGAIKNQNLQYKAYDYYNQYDRKDIMTLRKNILSSLSFLKAQFIAIKQETGKEYIYPPSINKIKTDVKTWKGIIEKINPDDAKYYTAILEILDNKKYNPIRGTEDVYKICNQNKKSDLSPYMWMFIAPPVLNHIDNSNKENENNIGANNNSNPDLTIQGNDSSSEANKINLISSNDNFKEQREINDLLRIYNENIHDQLIFKVMAYHEMHKNYPYIEKENENIFNKIFLQNNICC